VSRVFQIAALGGNSRLQAFPLLQATWPDLDLAGWLAFADRFAGDADGASKGIAGLQDDSGTLCGLFAYRIDHTLRDGRILAIPLFTAMDLANSQEPICALLAAMKERARLCHCNRLRIELDRRQSGLADRLRRLGASRSGILHSVEMPNA
jgi:hypothetical protein